MAPLIPKEFLTKFAYNPLKRLNSWKEIAWISLPYSLDFPSFLLEIPSQIFGNISTWCLIQNIETRPALFAISALSTASRPYG
jgi:hypothetical protein